MDVTKLRSIPLFSGLSKKELREVARHADEVDVPEGKNLLHEGGTPCEFFAIEEGSVEVRRDDEVLAQLGPGDFFGETALLDRGVRNATVTTVEPSTLMVMTPAEFRAMANAMPSVATELTRAMEERGAAVAAQA
jgi:CRP/FNR family transcriptional regulator, cyclic AMP receptor protein